MRFDRMFFEARIDPEEKKRLLDEIVFLDKTQTLLFSKISATKQNVNSKV
jgi:hypothetical protein